MKQDCDKPSEKPGTKVQFRFYAELNDFLRRDRRQVVFDYYYHGPVSIKEAIENLGVPHSDVDLILVNGVQAELSRHLTENDYISVYPVFELLDISSLTSERKEPLRNIRFIVDCHLGRLAKNLRIIGFDTLYRNDYQDDEIRFLARLQNRIILTKDKGLLMAKSVTRGYYVRAIDTRGQTKEIIHKFDLVKKIDPLSRCLICNHKLIKLHPGTRPLGIFDDEGNPFTEIFRCYHCDKFFWKGSHYKHMIEEIIRYMQP